ncbi:hypothetical protein P7K49_017503 [Saguinus oedipus]|uniref:Uncharacterized protein n=1 Tax=Saguinus oedipus TaxID=9490 RepID=A0ABQ9V338_SAGOE|nr:hypothetical protein P7K49_017503 [Saguinus oedipus]
MAAAAAAAAAGDSDSWDADAFSVEDPVRKVGGGGTAGGDRWEGEDEDEDVKGSGERGSGLTLSLADYGPWGAARACGLWIQPRA